MMKFLCAENAKVDLFTQFKVNYIFELRYLSVYSKYRAIGLAKRLISRSITEASFHNYTVSLLPSRIVLLCKIFFFLQVLKIDTTGFYSQKVAQSLGFKTVLETFYSDYLDINDQPVFKVSPPHKSFQIMVKVFPRQGNEWDYCKCL